MDVDLVMSYQAEESNDYDKWLAFNPAQGARMSAMEHLVPEHKMAGTILHSEAARRVIYMEVLNEMFSTENNPACGISAVRALAGSSRAQRDKVGVRDEAHLDRLCSRCSREIPPLSRPGHYSENPVPSLKPWSVGRVFYCLVIIVARVVWPILL